MEVLKLGKTSLVRLNNSEVIAIPAKSKNKIYYLLKYCVEVPALHTLTCSQSTIEILEKVVEYVQS